MSSLIWRTNIQQLIFILLSANSVHFWAFWDLVIWGRSSRGDDRIWGDKSKWGLAKWEPANGDDRSHGDDRSPEIIGKL